LTIKETMATPTLESMYEEKLSPKQEPPKLEGTKENDLHNENLNDATIDGGEESKTDAVLDEIAAKVNGLDFRSDEDNQNGHELCKNCAIKGQGVADDNVHDKCMDTVRSQGETINTLINQLRVMFEEYTSMNNEREYYEELNEALIRCLELNEGAICISDEEEDGDKVGGKETCTSTQEAEGTHSTSHEKSNETTDVEMEMEKKQTTPSPQASDESEPKTNEENSEITRQTPSKTKMKRNELQRINEVLLREIFELRHQVEVLKENFRDYLNSEELSQSEYDTATDEEHVCSTCVQCMQCKLPVRNQDDDTSQSEDYQYQENENETLKIADESDTD